MVRPIVLGVVGDSAAGKTTVSLGLLATLGASNVTHIRADDYRRHDRVQEAGDGPTVLHPDSSHLDIMAQHVRDLRAGHAILKPVFRGRDGADAPPEYVIPRRFVIIEGPLGYHTPELSAAHDIRVFLAPAEELRRAWKTRHDAEQLGRTEQQVLAELERCESDSAAFIRPQWRRADIVVSFRPGRADDELDAQLMLRATLSERGLPLDVIDVVSRYGIRSELRDQMRLLHVPGDLDDDDAAAIEDAVWDTIPFARQLRSERLGVVAAGGQARRSRSLALVQAVILHALVCAKAAAAVEPIRRPPSGSPDALRGSAQQLGG